MPPPLTAQGLFLRATAVVAVAFFMGMVASWTP